METEPKKIEHHHQIWDGSVQKYYLLADDVELAQMLLNDGATRHAVLNQFRGTGMSIFDASLLLYVAQFGPSTAEHARDHRISLFTQG